VSVTLVVGLCRKLSLDVVDGVHVVDGVLCCGIARFDAVLNYGVGGARLRLREAVMRWGIDFGVLEITSKIGFAPKNGEYSLGKDALARNADQV